METFYTPPPGIRQTSLTIEGDELNHLAHVLRLRVGDTIRVVDGGGNAYDALITDITRKLATCSITARHALLHESSRELMLGVAVLKNPSRFDFLVEKTVELGVRTIVPLLTERTIPRPGKVDRWQKLCLAAMKQSGRCILPTVRMPMSLGSFFAAAPPEARKVIAHEQRTRLSTDGGSGVTGMVNDERRIVVCIGPEGGFSDDEIRQAGASGFETVWLGPRRLRAETAAIVTVASLLGEYGGPAFAGGRSPLG